MRKGKGKRGKKLALVGRGEGKRKRINPNGHIQFRPRGLRVGGRKGRESGEETTK